MPAFESDRGPSTTEASARIVVGLKGKHPAFDDFIEGVGEESPLLRRVHEELLFGGLRSLVDSGKWNGREVVPGSKARHWLFMWQRGREFLLGVMAPSSDGRAARTSYPLVLAAAVSGLDVFRAERRLVPVLRSALEALQGVRSEAEVDRVVRETAASCREAVGSDPAGGAGRVADYGAEAGRFLDGDWLRQPAESLARVFHVLRAEFSGLAPSGRSGAAGSEPACYEILRLPVGDSAGEGLAGWLGVLRGQIDNEVSLLLVRAEGQAWLDVFAGRIPTYPDPGWPSVRGEQPLSRSLACVQMGLDLVRPESEEPYSLTPEATESVPRLVASYRRRWDDPERETVFGRLPRGYSPRLPGEGVAPETERPRVVRQPERGVSNREPRSRRKALLAVAAGVAILAGLGIWGLFFHGRNSGSASEGGQGADGGSSSAEVVGIPEVWKSYREDHRRWLAAFASPTPPLVAEYVRTNEARIRSTLPAAGGLDPAQVLGSQDPVDLAEPSSQRLRSRAAAIRAAARYRDELAGVLTTGYPADFRKRTDELLGTPLAGGGASLLGAFNRTQAGLGEQLIVPTNAAASRGPAMGITNLLAEHARIDGTLSALSRSWAEWQEYRKELESASPATLGPLLSESESALASQTNPAALLATVPLLKKGAEGVETCVRSWWTNVDRPGFEHAWQGAVPVRSYVAWTNLAGGFLRGFAGTDPRQDLKRWLEQTRLTDQVADLSAAAGRGLSLGVDVSVVSNRLQELEKRRITLDQAPALRRTEREIRTNTAALQADFQTWESQVRPAWESLFDFRMLVERERKRDFGVPEVTQAWTQRLDRTVAPALGLAGNLPAAEVRSWRDRFEAAAPLFTDLAAVKAGWPDAGGPAATLAPVGFARDELAAALTRDTLELALDRLIDRRWVVQQTVAGYLASPERARDVARSRELAAAIAGTSERWAGLEMGAIPVSLEDWRPDAQRLADTNGYVLTRGHRVSARLAEQTRPLLGGREAFRRLADGASRLERPVLALTLALGLESGTAGSRPNLESWQEAVELYRLAAAKSVGTTNRSGRAPALPLADWLDQAWRKLQPPAGTWEQIRQLAETATRAGIPTTNWPAALAGQAELARLIASFESSRIPEFQESVRRYLESSRPRPAQEAALRGILTIGPTNRVDWTDLGPVRKGFQATPVSENRVRLSRGSLAWDFRLFDGGAGDPVYLGETEVSTGDFVEAIEGVLGTEDATLRRSLVNEWARGFRAATNALRPHFNPPGGKGVDWPVFGLMNSTLGVPAGRTNATLMVREARALGRSGGAAEGLRGIERVSPKLPANFISPALAAEFARAFGFRLLTPAEWTAVDTRVGGGGAANLRDPGTGVLLRELEKELQIQITPGLQVLFAESIVEGASGGETSGDGVPWLAEVSDPRFEQGLLRHWRGNVAEILASGTAYYLAGASFVSPKAEGVVALPVDLATRPYFDVGFRLAFGWAGSRPADEIRRLLSTLEPGRP